jgi:hypothetical protein
MQNMGMTWRMLVTLHLDDPSIAGKYFAHDVEVL